MLVTSSCGGSAGQQTFQQPQPVAGNLVVAEAFAGERFPGREAFGRYRGEELQVVQEAIDLAQLRTDDHHRRRSAGGQGGRHQRQLDPQAPSTGGHPSRRKSLDDLGKTLLLLERFDQFQQPLGGTPYLVANHYLLISRLCRPRENSGKQWVVGGG